LLKYLQNTEGDYFYLPHPVVAVNYSRCFLQSPCVDEALISNLISNLRI